MQDLARFNRLYLKQLVTICKGDSTDGIQFHHIDAALQKCLCEISADKLERFGESSELAVAILAPSMDTLKNRPKRARPRAVTKHVNIDEEYLLLARNLALKDLDEAIYRLGVSAKVLTEIQTFSVDDIYSLTQYSETSILHCLLSDDLLMSIDSTHDQLLGIYSMLALNEYRNEALEN